VICSAEQGLLGRARDGAWRCGVVWSGREVEEKRSSRSGRMTAIDAL
jgi:hypothetical protein